MAKKKQAPSAQIAVGSKVQIVDGKHKGKSGTFIKEVSGVAVVKFKRIVGDAYFDVDMKDLRGV